MTREELKEHCKKQIESCEMWAKAKGEEPSGRVYEEHKLILELLEQESIIDKIEEELNSPNRGTCDYFVIDRIEEIINEHKAGGEGVCS